MRWLRARLLAGIVALAAPIAAADADPWFTRAPLLEAVQEVAVAELGGKVYVVGGLQGTAILNRVEVWDPVADAWSYAATLPIPLHHTTATAVGGKLYVIGGWPNFFATPTARVFAYDPVTNMWAEKAAMPTARGSPAAAAVGGKIYVAGGDPGATDFAVYDPVQNTWQVLPAMPTGRQHLAAVGIGPLLHHRGSHEPRRRPRQRRCLRGLRSGHGSVERPSGDPDRAQRPRGRGRVGPLRRGIRR